MNKTKNQTKHIRKRIPSKNQMVDNSNGAASTFLQNVLRLRYRIAGPIAAVSVIGLAFCYYRRHHSGRRSAKHEDLQSIKVEGGILC